MTEQKLVYIASPYAGGMERNIIFARQACRYCIAEGHVPVAPHLLYTQLLDDSDPAQRQAGLALGLKLLEYADELWICGDSISTGMAAEIHTALERNIRVRRVPGREICVCEMSALAGQRAETKMMMMR